MAKGSQAGDERREEAGSSEQGHQSWNEKQELQIRGELILKWPCAAACQHALQLARRLAVLQSASVHHHARCCGKGRGEQRMAPDSSAEQEEEGPLG